MSDKTVGNADSKLQPLMDAIHSGPDRVFRDYDVMSWFAQRGGGKIEPYKGYAGGGTGTGTGTGNWSSVSAHCSHTGTKVFSLRAQVGAPNETTVEVWAVQQHHIKTLAVKETLDVWLSLNGSNPASLLPFVNRSGSRLTKAWDAFMGRLEDTETGLPMVISLDWPDRSIPLTVSLTEFWATLLEGFQWQAALKPSKKIKVAVSCIGSHGRTGTCLAAMLAAAGMAAKDAILSVREIHCAQMLETKDQEGYIGLVETHARKVQGMKVVLHPKAAPPAATPAAPTVTKEDWNDNYTG